MIFAYVLQLDVALDIIGHADKPDVALACLLCLKTHGILVLDGSMDCPLSILYGKLKFLLCWQCGCDPATLSRQIMCMQQIVHLKIMHRAFHTTHLYNFTCLRQTIGCNAAFRACLVT